MIEKLLEIKHWHISEHFFNSVGAIAIKRFEEGKSFGDLLSEPPLRVVSSQYNLAQSENFPFKTIVNDKGEKVALIPLYGTMTKWGGLCSYGTAELAQMIDLANASKNIEAIIIDAETPGGASNSIEVMDRAIERSQKPIVGYVNDMAASAGLWVMSAVARKGKVLVDSLQNSSMGSIGSLMVYQNMAARLRDNGLDVKIIRAPQSVDKAKPNSIEPLTDEMEMELKLELKVLTDSFIGAVKANYGNGLKVDTPKLFTGGMFNGQHAIEIGLAHDQGDLTNAYELALDMAGTNKKKTFYTTNMNTFKRLGLSFSIAQKLSAEELENLAEAADKLASVEALEEERNSLKEQNGTLQTEIEGFKSTISNNEKALEEKDTKIAELEAKLDAAPAAPATTVVSQSEDHGDKNKKVASYNQRAMDKVARQSKN